MADTSLTREGLGGQTLDVSGRIHDLLLVMAGRIDDDALVRARELLALGEFDRAIDFTTGCLVAGAVPVTSPERDELSSLLVEVRSPAALAARINLAEQLPSIQHRFTSEAEPVAVVTEVLSRLAGRLPALNWVRCVSRLTPAGPSPAGGTQRVVLAEVGRTGFPHALAFLLRTELLELGVSAIVDVWREGNGLSDYHATALKAAVEVPLPTPAVGPGPSAQTRSYAASDSARSAAPPMASSSMSASSMSAASAPAEVEQTERDAESRWRSGSNSSSNSASSTRGSEWSSRRSGRSATGSSDPGAPTSGSRPDGGDRTGNTEASDDDGGAMGGGAGRPSWMPRTAAATRPDDSAPDAAETDLAAEQDELVADIVQLPRPDSSTSYDEERDDKDDAGSTGDKRSRRSAWARRQTPTAPDDGPELVDDAVTVDESSATKAYDLSYGAGKSSMDNGHDDRPIDAPFAGDPADGDSDSDLGSGSSSDSKLTEKERDLLRKLHEELAQREQGGPEEPSAEHGGMGSYSGRRHATNIEQTGPITRISGMEDISYTAGGSTQHRQNNGHPPFQTPS